jgi:DNA-binding winged helix-turn-helix (wHTH) protein
MPNQERIIATIAGKSRGPDGVFPEANYSGKIRTDSKRGPSARTLLDFKCGDKRFQDGMCVFPGRPPVRCTIVDLLNLPPYQSKEKENPVLSCQTKSGIVVVDKNRPRQVWINDEDYRRFTKTQYSFLVTLMQSNGGNVTHEELLKESRTTEKFVYFPTSDDPLVRIHIQRLRQNLGQVGANGFIETVPGGYRMDIPERSPLVTKQTSSTELQSDSGLR